MEVESAGECAASYVPNGPPLKFDGIALSAVDTWSLLHMLATLSRRARPCLDCSDDDVDDMMLTRTIRFFV